MKTADTSLKALHAAIKYCGSQAALAGALGISKQAVNSWVKNRNRLPIDRAIEIERVTERQVLRQDLRPDLFS